VDADIAQVIAGRYYIGIVLNMIIRYTETEHMEGESCNSLVTSKPISQPVNPTSS